MWLGWGAGFIGADRFTTGGASCLTTSGVQVGKLKTGGVGVSSLTIGVAAFNDCSWNLNLRIHTLFS